jgi:hypothetical protein
MAPRPRQKPEGGKDWFLREWLVHLHKKQAWIARDLDWDRGRVSKLYNGRQPYTRDDVNEISSWLGIEPFELLMSPPQAEAYRQLRDAAALIVAGADAAKAANG